MATATATSTSTSSTGSGQTVRRRGNLIAGAWPGAKLLKEVPWRKAGTLALVELQISQRPKECVFRRPQFGQIMIEKSNAEGIAILLKSISTVSRKNRSDPGRCFPKLERFSMNRPSRIRFDHVSIRIISAADPNEDIAAGRASKRFVRAIEESVAQD